jgi:hypothetical protein
MNVTIFGRVYLGARLESGRAGTWMIVVAPLSQGATTVSAASPSNFRMPRKE